ncbi:MAG: AAA family ATPase [Thermoflexales bacterium]|nr:AAA family ATPase [Thermoflexales bacterium]
MNEAVYRGARWLRADLHLHSPGAPSFTFPAGLDAAQRDVVVAQYVQQLKAQGIVVAAITDYQQIRKAWFTPIREAAHKEGIFVYPGVELSFGGGCGGKHGLHVLAIFSWDGDPDALNRAVDKLLDDDSQEPLVRDDGTHRDLCPKENLAECLIRLRRQTDCLLIFPHPNDNNGLLKTYAPAEAAELLERIRPDAIEQFDAKDRQRLLSTGKIARQTLDRIAGIQSSDNHSLAEIGTKAQPDGARRATYLKLSAPEDLRALRLALRDAGILVRAGDPPLLRHTRVERLALDGNGFLGNLQLDFSSDLNVLIGGRGVGKSAVLEVLRYALDLPAYAPTDYREGLVKHALGSGGKATLMLRQAVASGLERRYRVERVVGEEVRVYELRDEATDARPVGLAPRNLFTEQDMPLAFGQREIYEITQSAKLRRQLLDDLVGQVAQQQLRQIEKLRDDLRRNARALIEARAQQQRRDEVEQRLREIEHDVRLFDELGIANKLAQETALTRDEERLRRAEDNHPGYVEEWRELAARWGERWSATLADLARAESSQRSLLQEDAAAVVRELRAGFEALFRQGDEALAEAERRLATVRQHWQQARQNLDEELRRIRQELGTQALDPNRLMQLTAEQERLSYELDLLRRADAEAQRLEAERRELLRQLREARRQAFKLRDDQARAITSEIGSRVQVEVVYRGQRRDYADALANFFGGSRIPRRDLESIAYHQDIPDGWALAELARQGKEALQAKTGLSDAQAQRLLDFLAQDESRWFDLELLSPDDEVRVSLNVNDRWLELDKLSAGQRATAMLLILLTQRRRLLLVDQPEDDLDNRFVFEDVVSLLRKQKDERQFIMATHNANIPVLAHAELIVALEAEADRARVAVQGGMDHPQVQDAVRRLMEGGEEAFRRRAEKYGLEV